MVTVGPKKWRWVDLCFGPGKDPPAQNFQDLMEASKLIFQIVFFYEKSLILPKIHWLAPWKWLIETTFGKR